MATRAIGADPRSTFGGYQSTALDLWDQVRSFSSLSIRFPDPFPFVPSREAISRQFTKVIADLGFTLYRATTVRCGPSPRLDRIFSRRSSPSLSSSSLPFVFSSFHLRTHTIFLLRKSAGRSSYFSLRCHGRISSRSSCVSKQASKKSATSKATSVPSPSEITRKATS